MYLAQNIFQTNSPFSEISTTNIVVGILFIIVALVLFIPGAMATAGKLPGNKIVGLRVPEVRKNESTWVQAHRVTGPFWVLGAVALAFGAAFSFIASGWMWVLPVVAVVAAVVSISVGGNFGARAAALVDAAIEASDSDAGSGAGSGAGAEPAPQVNLDALRKAAGRADEA